jgi:hypothetical protein
MTVESDRWAIELRSCSWVNGQVAAGKKKNNSSSFRGKLQIRGMSRSSTGR